MVFVSLIKLYILPDLFEGRPSHCDVVASMVYVVERFDPSSPDRGAESQNRFPALEILRDALKELVEGLDRASSENDVLSEETIVSVAEDPHSFCRVRIERRHFVFFFFSDHNICVLSFKQDVQSTLIFRELY